MCRGVRCASPGRPLGLGAQSLNFFLRPPLLLRPPLEAREGAPPSSGLAGLGGGSSGDWGSSSGGKSEGEVAEGSSCEGDSTEPTSSAGTDKENMELEPYKVWVRENLLASTTICVSVRPRCHQGLRQGKREYAGAESGTRERYPA